MLTLLLFEPHWLGAGESRDDQCAHGKVLLSVGEHHLVTPEGGNVTLCAAALNLLRTLEHDHTLEHPVAEGCQLLPCCGFNVWLIGERFPVFVAGCSSGVDFEVLHTDAGVVLRDARAESVVPEHEWRAAIIAFADAVLAFYRREPPRTPLDDSEEGRGWQAFWQEYGERLDHHRLAI